MQEQLTQAFDAWVTLDFTARESRGGIPDTFAPNAGKRVRRTWDAGLGLFPRKEKRVGKRMQTVGE